MKMSLFRNTTALALCVALAAPVPVMAQDPVNGTAAPRTGEERLKQEAQPGQADAVRPGEDVQGRKPQDQQIPDQAQDRKEEPKQVPDAEEPDADRGAPAAGHQAQADGSGRDTAPGQGKQAREGTAPVEAPGAQGNGTRAEKMPENTLPITESGDPDDIRATGEQAEILPDDPDQATGLTPEGGGAAPEMPESPADIKAQEPAGGQASERGEAQAGAGAGDGAAEPEGLPDAEGPGAAGTPEKAPEDKAAEAKAVEMEAEMAEQRQEQRRASDALLEDAEAAQVREETVTEATARASDEEFGTSVNETVAPAMAGAGAQPTGTADDGGDNALLNTLAKAALAGLGAYAVGAILDNGDEVVSNSGDRVVVQRDGQYVVLKDDDALLRQPGNALRTETYNDGSTRSTMTREDGGQVVTVRAADGTVLQRTRVLPDGRQVVLFDDTRQVRAVRVQDLPQPPAQVVEYADSDLRALEQALARQADVNRRFSLSQVRDIRAVRALVPEISVDQITFETGSSVIRPAQARALSTLGKAMHDMIEENPGEVFLVEGHTDAVGQAGYNLALSDRRAESLALALTEYFDVPPENMIVQGYGESDLRVQTQADERANRRAAVRRITPLLQEN